MYKQGSNVSADQVPMLDSTPIRRPVSQSSGSRSPRFFEHIAEMEDTSTRLPPSYAPHRQPLAASDTDSPTLGHDSAHGTPATRRGLNTPLADDIRRTQHLMSWINYEANQTNASRGEEEQMMAAMTPRTPPRVRTVEQVSPDNGDAPIDRAFVVSPMGSVDRKEINR